MNGDRVYLNLWDGTLFPRQNQLIIRPQDNNKGSFSLSIEGRKSINYLISMEIESTINSGCSNPKLSIVLGGVQQLFNLRSGYNKIEFIASTLANNGRKHIRVGSTTVSCDQSSVIRPILTLKKAMVKEL